MYAARLNGGSMETMETMEKGGQEDQETGGQEDKEKGGQEDKGDECGGETPIASCVRLGDPDLILRILDAPLQHQCDLLHLGHVVSHLGSSSGLVEV